MHMEEETANSSNSAEDIKYLTERQKEKHGEQLFKPSFPGSTSVCTEINVDSKGALEIVSYLWHNEAIYIYMTYSYIYMS